LSSFRRGAWRRPQRERSTSNGVLGGINAGVAGGALMMLIAIVWFVGGLAAGILFFYPPVLLVVGMITFFKGLASGE
jgi:hypothetical protein